MGINTPVGTSAILRHDWLNTALRDGWKVTRLFQRTQQYQGLVAGGIQCLHDDIEAG